MKKTLIAHTIVIAIAFITISNSHSQSDLYHHNGKPINSVDVNGLRQGYWKITLGMIEGDWNIPDANKIVKEGNYTDSYPSGTWKEYHSESEHTEWTYNDDHIHATARRYRNNKLIAETSYEKNLHQGAAKKYYDNERVWTEMTWKDGRLDGPAKTYYPDGQLCEEGYWKYTWWESYTYHRRLR